MEYEIKPKEQFSLGLREIWRYRELFYFFTWRDIKVKYKQAVLGAAWAVLQPVLMMLIFTFVFSRIAPPGKFPYPLFAITGLLIWNVFSSGLSGAGNSMVSNAGIIRKIYFPRLIIPVSSVLVALFDFIMALPVLIAMMIYYNRYPGIEIVWCFPLALLLVLVAASGAGCLLSALTVKYRDFRYVLPFLIQVLLFVTPVIYPPEMLSGNEWVQHLLMINPVSGAVMIFRGMFDGSSIDWMLCGISAASALLLLVAGLVYFRKTESYFADLA